MSSTFYRHVTTLCVGKCDELWDGSVTLALEVMEVGQGLGIMLVTLHHEYIQQLTTNWAVRVFII